MIDLKATYGRRYRISLDASAGIQGQTKAERLWLYQIPCRYGHVFVHSATMLGAFTDRSKIGTRLRALPGVRVHQLGDRECSVIFPPERLEAVATLLRAKRRPVRSEAQQAATRAALAKLRGVPREGTSRTQEPRLALGWQEGAMDGGDRS